MREIRVNTARPYSVQVGPGALERLGTWTAQATGARRAAIFSDSAVYPLYGRQAQEALLSAGMEAPEFVFPQGEGSKSLDTFGRALHFLCQGGFTRFDAVVALGGGVVGDLAGFAAAAYQRGIAYVQVPTTLLSMVDSSVGGKTGVNLPGGKNQAGCFHQPSLVVCDTSLLDTLPRRQRRCGWAEVIKMAMLFDPALLRLLETPPRAQEVEEIVRRCIRLKAEVVEQDELDRGRRALLNFGHTVGHAVEHCRCGVLTHGEAVAIGMAVVTRGAVERGICPGGTLEQLLGLLRRYGLPAETDVPLEAVLAAARRDKKRRGEVTAVIVPEKAGRCRREDMSDAQLRRFLWEGGLR